jgi:hypothetical protein
MPTKVVFSSKKPMKSWGDTEVLNLMGFGEVYSKADLNLLGDDFDSLPELLVRAQDNS